MRHNSFIKLTNAKCEHRGLKLVEGINIDTIPFDKSAVCGGGIHFCTYENIGDWVLLKNELMMYVWDVTLPEGEHIVDMGNKLKSHRVILSNKRYIWDNYDICMNIVKRNGLMLAMVDNQTYDICLYAVKQYGRALQFVKNKTRDICIEAVMEDESALEFVDNDKESIYRDAIRKKILREQKYKEEYHIIAIILFIEFIWKLFYLCLKNY
jgi:hypothetical protein